MQIKEIIQKLKTGNREERKQAHKELEAIWHNHNNVKNGKMFLPLLKDIENFDSIEDIDNQVAFITALKWVFLSLGDIYFSLCKDFILKILQNKSGTLRYAMIHSADYLKLSLHLFSVPLEQSKISKKEKDIIAKHQLLFCQLAEEVEELINKYSESKFKRYKYIQSLPPSVYKSLQTFSANLLVGPIHDEIYQMYLYEKHKQEFDKKRQEFEKGFVEQSPAHLKENKKWDYYYDAMEHLNIEDTKMAGLLLQKAIDIDNNFVAGYMGITAVHKLTGNKKELKKYTDLAYEKTRKVFPKWPKEMQWGVLENRQYLRAICDKACLYHQEDDFKKAEDIYRLILRMNPNDNQGVRYLLAGMFAGLDPEDIDDLFDQGNKLQDWSKLENMLEKQNKEHHFWAVPDIDSD